ncbi:hypothetical protein K435DRAFT_774561 [Dendrothele bispora CBS 962.96]|uniref:ferric-chelate reductase (NADPH) n=1 Tax=Dendrothele bispora (strain CBS 962.96) TaxID=1314807 RepID=A0A4V4HHT9_DENBC|nr:hypothetical protein K435DRAFT_774561 [Dendrothele bispora CBS 962.96]
MASANFGDVLAGKAPNPDRDLRIYRASQYPYDLWFLVASFIALITLCRFLSFLLSKIIKRKRSSSPINDEEKVVQDAGRTIHLRRLPIALVNLYRIIAYRLTFTIGSFTINLAEIFICLAYIAANFVFLFINSKNVAGVFDITYWNNRAGAIATSQFPLIIALATKNNIISLLTGVGYEKLSFLHRIVARTALILTWVHAGGNMGARFTAQEDEVYLQTGVMATVAFTFLFVFSLRPIRGQSYEIFFYTHMAMSLIILGGTYYHAAPFPDGTTDRNYGAYVWPCFLIWGLDRIIRAVRLVLFNHSYFGFGSGSGSGTLDATTELLSPSLVRITMKRPGHFHWTPGQYAYLVTPGVSLLPFEGHPFTIVSHDSRMSSKEISMNAESSQTADAASSATPFWKELVFLVDVQKGYTKRLAEVAARKETIKAYIDGPYGRRLHLDSVDAIVLIAGGTGVSYIIPILLDVVERKRMGKTICKRIVFVWSVRDSNYIQWVSEAIQSALELAPSSLTIEIRLFVTGSVISESDDANSTNSKVESPGAGSSSNEVSPRSSGIEISGLRASLGRAPLTEILEQEAGETRFGTMCVAACGSSSMNNSVREALRWPVAGPATVMRGGASISLIVENFAYA